MTVVAMILRACLLLLIVFAVGLIGTVWIKVGRLWCQGPQKETAAARPASVRPASVTPPSLEQQRVP